MGLTLKNDEFALQQLQKQKSANIQAKLLKIGSNLISNCILNDDEFYAILKHQKSEIIEAEKRMWNLRMSETVKSFKKDIESKMNLTKEKIFKIQSEIKSFKEETKEIKTIKQQNEISQKTIDQKNEIDEEYKKWANKLKAQQQRVRVLSKNQFEYPTDDQQTQQSNDNQSIQTFIDLTTLSQSDSSSDAQSA